MHTPIFTKYLIGNKTTMTRSRYLGAKFALAIFVILVGLFIFLSLIFFNNLFPSEIFNFIGLFVYIGLCIFAFISSTALDVNRFRNMGYSGYWCLLIIIPWILINILSKINQENNDLIINIFSVALGLVALVTQLLLFLKKGKKLICTNANFA